MPVASKRNNLDNHDIGRRLLKVREVSVKLGLSVDYIHKLVQTRSIPHVKVGRALRFDTVALDRYIEKHAVNPID